MGVFGHRARAGQFAILAILVSWIALLAQPGPAIAANGDWSLTKAANPTTFSAAGQVITYTYTITNNIGIDGVIDTFTDDHPITGNTCSPGTPVPAAGLTCTAQYTTTAADVAAGSTTNHVIITGRSLCDCNQPVTVTAQATITFKQALGSITIVKNAVGRDAAFNFTSTIAGAASFVLATSGGTASRVFTALAPGLYTVSEVNLPFRWKLTSLSCVGDTGGLPTTVNLVNGTASIGLDGGEAIVCTFVNAFDLTQQQLDTQAIIYRFLSHRIDLLVDSEPDRDRFIRRLLGSLWGDDDGSGLLTNSSGGGPFSFAGGSSDLSSTTTFSTSLSRIQQAHAGADAAGAIGNAMGYAPTKAPKKAVVDPSGFDLWIEAHYFDYGANDRGIKNGGNFGIVYVGADYLVTRSFLLGALVQVDTMSEKSSTLGSSIGGTGFMAGPYASVRLTPNVFFDARAAWGTSGDHINPFGFYTDSFSTDRWLARANLTGNWRFGGFRITPTASVIYVEENQHNYIDSLGVFIPSQSVALGRFSIWPEFAYRFIQADGTIWEPHFTVKGNWDFKRPNATQIGGLIVTGDEFSAGLEAGLLGIMPHGWSFRTSVSYDGVGSSHFHSVGGKVWINVPLH